MQRNVMNIKSIIIRKLILFSLVAINDLNGLWITILTFLNAFQP